MIYFDSQRHVIAVFEPVRGISNFDCARLQPGGRHEGIVDVIWLLEIALQEKRGVWFLSLGNGSYSVICALKSNIGQLTHNV